jgi:hypothetical protein
MRLPAVLSVCTKTAWPPSARAVTAAAAGLDTLAKAGVAAIAAAAAVVAAAKAAAAVTRIAVLTKTPQVPGGVRCSGPLQSQERSSRYTGSLGGPCWVTRLRVR